MAKPSGGISSSLSHSPSPTHPKKRKSSPIPESLVLHIDTLTSNVNEDHLREICGNFGEVTSVRIERDPNVNLLQGSGYVEFKTQRDAEKAKFHMDGAQIDGKVVQATFTLATGSRRYVANNDVVGANAEKEPLRRRSSNSSSNSLKNTEDLLIKAIDELLDEEEKIAKQIYRRGGRGLTHTCVIPDDLEGPPHVPRAITTPNDPEVASRTKRLLGGALRALITKPENEDASKKDAKLACKPRSIKEDEEQIEEHMITDLQLRAVYAHKAQEKILDLTLLRLSEHHRLLGNFLRTKAEPPIYYLFAKQLEEDRTSLEQRKKLAFDEWKAAMKLEFSKYLEEINVKNVENCQEVYNRWWDGRNTSAGNDVQETTYKEPETHGVEPVLKKRRTA